jgi:hypothetical protein
MLLDLKFKAPPLYCIGADTCGAGFLHFRIGLLRGREQGVICIARIKVESGDRPRQVDARGRGALAGARARNNGLLTYADIPFQFASIRNVESDRNPMPKEAQTLLSPEEKRATGKASSWDFCLLL